MCTAKRVSKVLARLHTILMAIFIYGEDSNA